MSEKLKLKNQRSSREWNIFDATMVAEGVEETSVEETIEAWSLLISTKTAYSLQGFFGRTATSIIDNELIDKDGVINWNKIDS